MDFVKRWLTQIQAQLQDLTLSQKMLIATLVVVIPMMLLLIFQWAAAPEMVPVLDQSLDPARQTRITAILEGQGIKYKLVGDRIMVPREKQLMALATAQMQNLLPEDTSAGFDKIVVGNQNWWNSNEQNRTLYNIAKQKVLAAVLTAYPWVHDATVIISPPQETGFGATHQRPTASVNIVLQTGQLDQKRVDAVAGLVSGAVAEMRPEDVNIIDAVNGRQWKVRPEGETFAGDYLEQVQIQEAKYREKIQRALGYIPNVIVAVNVEVDMTRRQTNSRSYDKDASVSLVTKEHTHTEQTTEAAPGGEPGVRSNAGQANAGAAITAAAPRQSSTEESDTEFDAFAGEKTEVSANPGGMPTQINATVNIPRSYFVTLFQQGKAPAAPAPGEQAPAPTDEALAPTIEAALPRIKKQIEMLVATGKNPGQVVVDVYPDAGAPFGAPGAAQPAGFAGSLLASGGTVKMISLGSLVLVALGAMLMLLRSATRKPPRPSVQELAGVPPKVLDTDLEFIGQAEEMDPAMTGLELDEAEIRHRKLTEQIGDMVKANPAEVASLINRWATRTE